MLLKSKDGFYIVERDFSDEEENLSLGIANIHAEVPGIEANKNKIARALEIFKEKRVNLAVFPEFCLAGYFWEETSECRKYMDQAVIENHTDWLERTVEPLFDDYLKAVVFNNIRKGPQKKFLNSTYVLTATHDCLEKEDIYNKVFLPPIEKIYTESGLDDRLVIDTRWGKFGFTTCYDYLFSQLILEYSKIDQVDAIIQLASWRAMATRDYPGMNVATDTYYGDLWDMVIPAKSATNQVWTIACNAVGVHGITGARFWGGSGLWAPSGMRLVQASRFNEELLIIHNLDIKGQKRTEQDDFNYAVDFTSIYRPVHGKRAFTRITD